MRTRRKVTDVKMVPLPPAVDPQFLPAVRSYLIGKACGQRLYKMWGGGRDQVIPYASLISLSTPEERADLATRLMSEGWKALKLRLHHETMQEDLRTVEAVRKAVGDRMTIMVDANHHGGGNLGVIAHMHLVAAWSHAPYMELLHDPPVGNYRHRFAIMADPPNVDRDGYMSVPQGPGLGVEIDRALVVE